MAFLAILGDILMRMVVAVARPKSRRPRNGVARARTSVERARRPRPIPKPRFLPCNKWGPLPSPG
jgi:hypothetical protein